jgi:glycosyltransferase involved in cell wall biosynthesis
MKIFQVVPYYPPHIGGMEFYVKRLSEELAARGHDVTVFTSSNTPHQSIKTINKVRVCSLKIMTKVYNVPIVPTLYTSLLASEKPDVVHTHQYPIYFSDVAAFYKLTQKARLIVHVHVISDAKSAVSGLISEAYYSTLGLKTLTTADAVLVPSLAYKTKLSSMHINQNKLQVIPYGIEPHKFQKANGSEFRKTLGCESSKIILTVGRLNYQKGFHYLIQAMPAITKKIPNVKLVIVGEGEQLIYLKNLAQSLGLGESVIFTGAWSQSEIPDTYAACDVFVLPSLFESFGISLIEAQATGKPVVCTRTGGAPEAVIEGKTGLVVEPADPKQLENAIIRLLLDPELSAEMGQAGRRFVQERYDIKQVVTTLIEKYEKLAK